MEPVLLKRIDMPGMAEIETAVANGAYANLGKGLGMKPADLLELVKASGLRGRGGAGFPTGAKWGFAAGDPKTPRYLVCNADESEPGTFKDRPILEKDPHLLLEAMILSGHAIGAEYGFIYIRGEYADAYRILVRAVEQAYEKSFLGKDIQGSGTRFECVVHRGAGAYICGEETALLESIEGRRGQPRNKPPFPANVGLFGKPTVINNVETLANVPFIVERGAEWFKSMGTEKAAGPKLFCVSGRVNKPGVYELAMGTPLRTLIKDVCGGVPGAKRIKAVIPGGVSAAFLGPEDLDVKLDFESVAAAGSMFGSGGVIVLDEDDCIVSATLNIMRFFKHESCGKCTPCREGTYWLYNALHRIEEGGGRMEDLALLLDIADNISGKSCCPLADGAISCVVSSVKKFRAEYERHIREGGCPFAAREAGAAKA